jgi:hypothetical protein
MLNERTSNNSFLYSNSFFLELTHNNSFYKKYAWTKLYDANLYVMLWTVWLNVYDVKLSRFF